MSSRGTKDGRWEEKASVPDSLGLSTWTGDSFPHTKDLRLQAADEALGSHAAGPAATTSTQMHKQVRFACCLSFSKHTGWGKIHFQLFARKIMNK